MSNPNWPPPRPQEPTPPPRPTEPTPRIVSDPAQDPVIVHLQQMRAELARTSRAQAQLEREYASALRTHLWVCCEAMLAGMAVLQPNASPAFFVLMIVSTIIFLLNRARKIPPAP